MSRKLSLAMDVETNALLQVNPSDFYSNALLEDRSSSEFRQILNIKEKTKIGNLSFGELLFEADCEWQGGDSTLNAKTMEPCKVQIGTEMCMYELETSFLADQMKPGSNHADFIPADFANYFYSELARQISNNLELITWQADTSVEHDEELKFLDLCDGLEVQLCDADIPVDQVITGTPITSANVVAELTKVYNAIPKVLRKMKGDCKWFVSPEIADAYKLAVAVQSAEVYTNKDASLSFLGYELTIGEGMSDNVMTFSRRDNYIFLADMISDPSDLTVIDMRNTTGAAKIRVRGDFKVGFNYLNDDEWVVYGLGCAS